MPRPIKITAALLAAGLTAALAPAAHAASPHGALQRVQAAWAAPDGPTELTPLLRDLAIQMPHLHGAERRQAQSFLARPTDGTADPQRNGWSVPEAAASPYCSANFCVHWVDTTADAPNLADTNGNGVPDYVESVSAVAEQSHFVENDQLAWRAPKSDGARGGDSRTDVYLTQLGGTGIYGYSAPDPGQTLTTTDHSQFAYLVIDNDFQRSEFPQYGNPIVPLEVTLAHEYNHVLQFNYDSLQDTWMFESTAVWMEGKVFPADRDYLQYLRGWTQLTTLPLTSFNGLNPNDRNNVKVYGTSVWDKWLDERFGQETIRQAWEDSLRTKPQPSFAVAAFDRAISQHAGEGFADEFDHFAAATAEWQAKNSGFPEGNLYPDVRRMRVTSVGAAGVTEKLNHTTYALVNVHGAGSQRIRLGLRAPAGTAAAVALVGRTGSDIGGNATVVITELPAGGAGTVTLANPKRFNRITAVLVNSDAVIHGASAQTGDFLYTHDHAPFYARVSTDLAGPRVTRISPAAHARSVARKARIKVVFNEPVLGVDTGSLRVVASNGKAVPGSVSFTPGARVATFVPRGGLGRGRTYRVRVGSAVTDTTANPLRATNSAFTVGG